MDPALQLPARYDPSLETLGQGGFGVVYRSYDRILDLPVAVKVPWRGDEEELAREVTRELHATARVRHRGIVEVLDAGVEQGTPPWLVLELADGGSLAQHVEHAPAWSELAPLLDRVLEALGHMHALGMVHRDLKPDNVLLARCGDVLVPKLADFGLAKVAEVAGGFASTRIVAGTITYMAPELFEGDVSAVHPAADLYAFGVMLHILVSGEPPFEHTEPMPLLMEKVTGSPRPLRPRMPVPDGLEALVSKLLDREPWARPLLAADVRVELARLDGGSMPAPPLPPLPRPPGAAVATVRQPLLVGRATEMERLMAAALAAEAGPVGLSIAAPSGAGASRLVQELLVGLEEAGRARPLRVRVGDDPAPWPGVGAAIRRQWGLGRLLSDDLRERVQRATADPVMRAGLLDLLDPLTPREGTVGDARSAEARRLASLEVVLRHEAERGLAVIALEQRGAGRVVRSLANRLLRTFQAAPAPVLIVVDVPGDPPDGFDVLDVPMLAPDACGALLADVLPSDLDPGPLLERHGGSPLRLVQAARLLADRARHGGSITPQVVEATPGGDDATVSVSGLMEERLQAWVDHGAGEPGRRLLAALALLPPPVSRGLLATVLGFEPGALLDSAAFAGLVLERNREGFEYATPALLEPAARLAEVDLIARAGRALRDDGPESAGLRAARLLLGGGQPEEALALATTWARARVYRDGEAAVAALEVALYACDELGEDATGPRRREVDLERVRVARTLGDIDTAEAILVDLPDLGRPEVLELRATVDLLRGRLPDATAHAERSRAAFGAADDRAGVARAAVVHAQALFTSGRVADALRELEQAHSLAVEAGDARAELNSLWRLARARRSQGEPDRAYAELGRALELARALGARSTEGTVLRELGNTSLAQGDPERAAAHYEESVRRLEQGGFRGATATGRISLGELAREGGDARRARDEYAAALSLAQAYGQRGEALIALLNLAFVELDTGRLRSAARRLGSVDALLPPDSAHVVRPWVEALRLAIAALQGRWDEAEDVLEDVATRIGAMDVADHDIFALLKRAAHAAAEGGERPLAADALEIARGLSARAGDDAARAELAELSEALFG